MCDIWRDDRNLEFPVSLLEAQLPDMLRAGVEWVVLSGGEPLMHSRLFELSSTLRGHGIRVTILSTGLLLARFAHEVAANIDDIIVSLDGPREIHDRIRGVPHAFDLLKDGLAKLRSLRPDFCAQARCTVQRLNHAALDRTVQAAKELGFDSLSFLAADLTSTAFRRDPPWPRQRQDEIALDLDETMVLTSQLEALISSNDPFVVDRPEHLRRILLHFQAHLGLEEPRAPRCNAPWVSAVVEVDGAVRPCFFHHPIGHLNPGSLGQIVNSPAAVQFRESLSMDENETCRRCVCSLNLAS